MEGGDLRICLQGRLRFPDIPFSPKVKWLKKDEGRWYMVRVSELLNDDDCCRPEEGKFCFIHSEEARDPGKGRRLPLSCGALLDSISDTPPSFPYECAIIAVKNDTRICMIGGIERYHPVTKEPLPPTYRHLTGKLYSKDFFGVFSGGEEKDACHDGGWIEGNPMNEPIVKPHPVLLDDKLYVFGNQVYRSKLEDQSEIEIAHWAEVYDLNTQEWQVLNDPRKQLELPKVLWVYAHEVVVKVDIPKPTKEIRLYCHGYHHTDGDAIILSYDTSNDTYELLVDKLRQFEVAAFLDGILYGTPLVTIETKHEKLCFIDPNNEIDNDPEKPLIEFHSKAPCDFALEGGIIPLGKDTLYFLTGKRVGHKESGIFFDICIFKFKITKDGTSSRSPRPYHLTIALESKKDYYLKDVFEIEGLLLMSPSLAPSLGMPCKKRNQRRRRARKGKGGKAAA